MDVTIEFPNMTDLLCGMADVFKKLEATRAELAAERERKGGVAWAVKNRGNGTFDGSQFNSGHPHLHESKEAAEKWVGKSVDRLEVVPYPIGYGADVIAASLDRAERLESELATERAKPKGGVAWALKNRNTGKLDGSDLNGGHPNLHESKESAENWSAGHEFRWEAVPYPIGDGADELKAAIEAKEKAEAEVAAWKAAANHDYHFNCEIETPSDLCSRIDQLKEKTKDAKRHRNDAITELAALKAATAEVPPLDSWRVLATARRIFCDMADDRGDESVDRVIFASGRSLVCAVLKLKDKATSDPYQLKD